MKKLHALLFSFLTGSAMALMENNAALIAHKNEFDTVLNQTARDIVKKMNLCHIKWEGLHEEKYIIEDYLIDELSEQTFVEFGKLASSYIKYKAEYKQRMMLEKSKYPANSLVPSYFSVVQELQKTETTLNTLYFNLNKEVGKKVKNEKERCAIVEKLIFAKP